MPEALSENLDDLRAIVFLREDYRNEYHGLIMLLGDGTPENQIWNSADKQPILTFGEYLANRQLNYIFSEAMQAKIDTINATVQAVNQARISRGFVLFKEKVFELKRLVEETSALNS